MKLKRWWQKAVDREEWASVIKEAKAVRGPKSQEVSKTFYCFIDIYGYEVGVLFPAGRFFSSPRPGWFRGLPILLLNSLKGSLPLKVKRSECESDQAPPYFSWMFSSWESRIWRNMLLNYRIWMLNYKCSWLRNICTCCLHSGWQDFLRSLDSWLFIIWGP